MGEQLNFVVRTQSELGNYESILSSPPYPPQVWSSFVSFASFSTSVMSSMSTFTYYRSTFGEDMGLNVGIIATIVVIALLIFLELTQPVVEGKIVARLGRLRLRFNTVTWMLFVIFMGIVYTTVVLMITA
jgi:cytochrome c biogenesis protein CcdA